MMSPQKQDQRKKDQPLPSEREIEKPSAQKVPLDIDEIDEMIKKTEESRKEDQKQGE
ncbi:hypothetical protein MYX07_04390 [Patescibacteria group bacterium AH-259-L07]|nr:hypothetical protein [Patescibacteria group bacterium AH-259-L07]